MGWVKWLKGFSGTETPVGTTRMPPPQATGAMRRGRKPGEAYAKEWVKVLEDANPGRDAANTYTWELQPGEQAGRQHAPADTRSRAGGRVPRDARPAQADAFDTHAWELHETDSREDPWGLQKDAPKPPPTFTDGVNPYDTGVFNARWNGKFDNR